MESLSETCPKCGAARESAEAGGACPRCGLRLDLWSSFDSRPAWNDLIDPAFVALKPRLGDSAAHDAFIALARNAGLLDLAAARYHIALREDAAHKAQIDRALAQIAFIATHETNATAREGVDSSLRTLKTVATVVAVLLFCVVGVLLYRLLTHS